MISFERSPSLLQDYLKQSGLAYTLLLPSTFYDNMTHFTVYKKQPDGSYTFGYNMGSGPIAMQARDDVGRAVAGERHVSISEQKPAHVWLEGFLQLRIHPFGKQQPAAQKWTNRKQKCC